MTQMANFFPQVTESTKQRMDAAFSSDLNLHSFFAAFQQTSPHAWQFIYAGVCLSISEPQCWAGLDHRGFCNGVGGLCFVAQSSKPCLSVPSSCTSCNNTNRPLNRLLCCAALAWVTSHTLALCETHAYALMTARLATAHTFKFMPKTHVHTLINTSRCAGMHEHANNCVLLIVYHNQLNSLIPACRTLIDHLKLCHHSAWRPVCPSPLLVCLFVWTGGWLACCLFMADHLSQ